MGTETLDGKVAIVTGASRGIGRAIALRLARNGVRVAMAARTEPDLLALCREIESFGGEGAAIRADMASEPDIKRLVEATVERFSGLDIVVNNAGIGVFGPIENTPVEDWDRAMAVNARGPFLLCREAIPALKQSDGTSWIVNIGSVVSVKGYVNQAVYTASKHALMGMTKVLAQEVQQFGIRVHMICPGGVDTELIARARPDLDRTDLIRSDELADIVMFLLTQSGTAVIDEVNVRRATSEPWF